MDIINRLFYTAFSMGVISAMLVPVVILIRLVITKAPKRSMVYLWVLLMLRSICPIAMSSVLCMVDSWNRAYHMLLTEMGLTMVGEDGIMNGWMSVFIKQIETEQSYNICAAIWIAGVIFIWLFTFFRQRQIGGWLKDADKLDGRIYQKEGLKCPVIIGVIRPKIYIPGEMKAVEAKYVLKHMEIHTRRKDAFWRFIAFMAVTIQWFNPLMWLAYHLINVDIELAADEEVLNIFGIDERKKYAQELINMKKGKDIFNNTLMTFQERYVTMRASRSLYQKKSLKQDKQLMVLAILLCFIWWFMLRPLQILWNGGTWTVDTTSQEQPLFEDNSSENIVSELTTSSPDGLTRIVKLVMTDGTHTDDGYDGSFEVRIEDDYGTKLASESLDGVYSGVDQGKLHFDNGVVLYASDYNNDGIEEVAIGQEVEASGDNWKDATGKKKNKTGATLQQYFIWNVETEKFSKISDAIYTSGKEGVEAESCKFNTLDGTSGLLVTKVGTDKQYYVWDTDISMYEHKNLTKKQLKQYKTAGSDNESDGTDSADSGSNNYTLENAKGKTVVKVVTEADSTGSQAIKSLTLNPSGSAKKYTDIQGYYCNLEWAGTTDSSIGQYALLTYNGTKAQTFIVYDVKSGKVYYKQEDGNSVLNEVFKKYNGQEITFSDSDVVVYTLQEMEGDVLKIGFAANADGGITVKGSYKYDVENDTMSDLSYSQTTDTTAATATPSAE